MLIKLSAKFNKAVNYLLHLSATPCTAGVLKVFRNSTKSFDAFALSAFTLANSTKCRKSSFVCKICSRKDQELKIKLHKISCCLNIL